MSELNKQQLCAALNISESTVRRLEQAGLPFTPVGVRSHRYDLDECKEWLRTQYVPAMTARRTSPAPPAWKGDAEFMASCRRAQLRMSPSEK